MNQQFLLLSFKHLKTGIPASDPMKMSSWIMHQNMHLLFTEVTICSGFSDSLMETPNGESSVVWSPFGGARVPRLCRIWTLTVPALAVLSRRDSEPICPMLLSKATTISSFLSPGMLPWYWGWQPPGPLPHSQTQAQAKISIPSVKISHLWLLFLCVCPSQSCLKSVRRHVLMASSFITSILNVCTCNTLHHKPDASLVLRDMYHAVAGKVLTQKCQMAFEGAYRVSVAQENTKRSSSDCQL